MSQSLVPKPAKNDERVLTPLQKAFLEHLFSDECKGDVKAAMDLAGYAKGTSSTVVVRSLSEEIVELTKQFLATTSLRAAFATEDVMTRPEQLHATVKLNAARQILDRAGIDGKQEEIHLQVPSGGIVIIPAKDAKDDSEPLDVTPSSASHEKTIEHE